MVVKSMNVNPVRGHLIYKIVWILLLGEHIPGDPEKRNNSHNTIQVHFSNRSILAFLYEVYREVALFRHMHEINSAHP